MFSHLRAIRDYTSYQMNCLIKGRHFNAVYLPHQIFGDADYHSFIGYYDIQPFNIAETRILAGRCSSSHNARAMDRPLELGYYELETEQFIAIDKTPLWCWQQGCRLQWLSWHGQECVLYNTMEGGSPACVLYDIDKSERLVILPFAVYSYSHDGRYIASLDFDYLEVCRKGYGYDWKGDDISNDRNRAWFEIRDTTTLEQLALIGLDDVLKINPHPSMMEEGARHYFNHLHFNPSSSRLMVFHIWNDLLGKRRVRALTLNPDGTDMRDVTGGTHVSHYWWIGEQELLFYGTDPVHGLGYHLYNQNGGFILSYNENTLKIDGHPSQNPVYKTWLVSDTVVDKSFERHLWLYDMDDHTRLDVASFRSPRFFSGAIRCDLHPRWSPSGEKLAVDTSHNGFRQIFILDAADILKA